jgi:hypothetical protein
MPCKIVWTYCFELNLFETDSADEQSRAQQRRTTRIYILLFAIVFILVTFIAGLDVQLISNIQYLPSHIEFIKLMDMYPNSLKCPCSKTGITYETFVHIDVEFHPVCSSIFIKDSLFNSIVIQNTTSNSTALGLENYLNFFWQIIADFCLVSNRTWIDAVAGFGASHIISPMAAPETVIRIQAQSAIDNAIVLAQSTLTRNLLAIRKSTAGNQFVSGLSTNFYLSFPPADNSDFSYLKFLPRKYGNCSCLNSNGCPHPIMINNSYEHATAIPGMIGDCFMIDATLASTLECYYNATCLSLLHNTLHTQMTILPNSSNMHFRINSTIQTIIAELMLDTLTTRIRFDRFYEQCRPSFCSYSYDRRFSAIFIITTLIGIFGGVSFVLRLLAPFIANAIFQRRQQTHSSNDTSIVETSLVHRLSK